VKYVLRVMCSNRCQCCVRLKQILKFVCVCVCVCVCESVRMTEILNLSYMHMQLFAPCALASLLPLFISRDNPCKYAHMFS
jgi:Mn2+/Fe2+ NRAMP family transporter